MKPRAEIFAAFVLLTVAHLFLVSSCGDNGPSAPDLAGAYLINGSLALPAPTDSMSSRQVITITISRLEHDAPSPYTAQVLIDGDPIQDLEMVTPDLAYCASRFFATELGHVYVFSVSVDGISASGNLATPDQPCSLTITQPPPGNLTFSSGTDLALQWEYAGSEPGEFGVFGSSVAFPPRVFSDTLQASARSAVVETSQWSLASQVFLRVTARTRAEISGDLAAPTSSASVDFATSEVILTRR